MKTSIFGGAYGGPVVSAWKVSRPSRFKAEHEKKAEQLFDGIANGAINF